MEKTEVINESTVSQLAYQLWEDAGRPTGRDLEFWLAAEAKLRAGNNKRVETVTEAKTASTSEQRVPKASKTGRGGAKKTWPKPYPSLPKF